MAFNNCLAWRSDELFAVRVSRVWACLETGGSQGKGDQFLTREFSLGLLRLAGQDRGWVLRTSSLPKP